MVKYFNRTRTSYIIVMRHIASYYKYDAFAYFMGPKSQPMMSPYFGIRSTESIRFLPPSRVFKNGVHPTNGKDGGPGGKFLFSYFDLKYHKTNRVKHETKAQTTNAAMIFKYFDNLITTVFRMQCLSELYVCMQHSITFLS